MTQPTARPTTTDDATRSSNTWLRRIKRSLIGTVVVAAIWLAAGFLLRSLTESCMESRALARAEGYLKWTQRLRPWDEELLLFSARMARWRGDFESWQILNSSEGQFSEDVESWKLEAKLAEITQGLQQLDLGRCRRLMAESPSAVDVAEAFVVGFTKRGELGPAMQILDVWESDDPDSAQVSYLRGTVALAAREQLAARRAWETAIVREPQHELARQSLIELLIAEDQLDEALRHSSQLLELTRGSPAARILAARCLRLLGRTTDAMLVLGPLPEWSGASEWRLERGHLAYELGDYKVAAEYFSHSNPTRLSPPPLLMTAATVCVFAEQPDQAQQYFDWSSESLLAEGRNRESRLRQRLGAGDD